MNWNNIPNFKESEFACPCCGRNPVHPDSVYMLQRARTIADVSFTIDSAFRCTQKNKEVGGREDSSHLRSYAFDIRCTSSRNRFKIIQALILAGFTRIGIYENFIHADNDPDLDNEVVWYGK